MLLSLEVDEVQLQVILKGLEEVKKADGMEIHQGMDVGMVEHLLTLLQALVAVGDLLMDVWMEVGVVEHFHTLPKKVVAVGFLLVGLGIKVEVP